MCGIVGVIGTDIGYKHKKAFRDLLVVDTIRGGDSTGIIGVDGTDVITAKKAIDGWGFTNMTLFTKHMTALTKPTALIGHNRAATKGRITDGNAHPFKRDSTYLVHNGSLASWKGGSQKLHDADKTDVDSEAICFDVHENGFKNTIQTLHGAFALVSYDALTGIVSFARNSDRPLWFLKCKNSDAIMFASEAYMLYLVADKHDIDVEAESVALEPSTIVTYDLLTTGKSITDTMMVDEEVSLFVPPTQKWRGYGRGAFDSYNDSYWDDKVWDNKLGKYVPVVEEDKNPLGKPVAPNAEKGGSESGAIHGTGNVIALPSPKRERATLTDLGRAKGEHLLYIPFEYKPFSTDFGMITGDLYLDNDEHIKFGTAIMYKQTEKEYKDMRGKLVAVTANNVTYPFEKDDPMLCVEFKELLSYEQEEEYWVKYGDVDDYEITDFYGVDDQIVTEHEFKILVKDGCAMCMDAIPVTPKAAQEVSWVFDNQPLCPSCSELHNKAAIINNLTLEEQITGGKY